MPVPKILQRKDALRKNGTALLYLEIIIDRQRIRLGLNIHVKPSDFSKRSGRVKKSHPQSEDLNLVIEQALARCNDVLVRFRLQGIPLTKAAFLAAYNREGSPDDFLNFYENAMLQQYQQGKLAPKTLEHHTRQLRRLRTYVQEVMKQEILRFYEISPELMARVDIWALQRLKTKGRKGTGERYNFQKAVKKYLNLAKAAGFEFTNPYPRGSKIQCPPARRVFLEEHELKAFIQLYRSDNDFLTDADRTALRSFLFQCFTGLRYSELKALRPEDRHKSHIDVYSKKTEREGVAYRTVPLSRPATTLLAHAHQGKKFLPKQKLNYTPLLPALSEQKTNMALKKTAKMAGVKKHVTTHVGRHTFATLFLERGGKIEVLKELLGHRSISTTMIYVHMTESRRREQISQAFDDFTL